MNKKLLNKKLLVILVVAAALVSAGIYASIAYANHSWGRYHWARTTNPFNLNLGDNVSAMWDAYLGTTSGDWSLSSVLNTAIVSGGSTECLPTKGRVEVCNNVYGNNGWLGIAQIWVAKGTHITQGVVKLNDTYFDTAQYNTSAWRNLVMCQEVGHTLGLDHQDEIFDNPNLGTCMDYTDDPSTNQHPNQHDYDQLVTIYTHLDGGKGKPANGKGKPANVGQDIDLNNPSAWGVAVKKDARGNNSLYERDLSNGEKLFTFVIWAN